MEHLSIRKILFTIWIAILGGLLWGFEFEERVNMDALSGFAFSLAYPRALLFWFGLGVGFFLLPWILEWIEKDKANQKFQDEWKDVEMGRLKSRFFKYLSRAYEKWKSGKDNLPASFDRFADDALFPDWLPVDNKELYARSRTELTKSLTPHWQFASDLYAEIENYIKRGANPTLLTEAEADEFHDVRQDLSYFWEETGKNVFHRRRIKYKNILPAIESDNRIIKFLPYLSVVLHYLNEQKGPGAQHMYMLGAKFYRGVHFSKLPWRP